MACSVSKKLETICAELGARLTVPRRDVFSVIAKADKPVGAYDILRLMPEGTKPPTVYRALEFLESVHLIHRIESLNAYVLCCDGHGHEHSAQFAICQSCGDVQEMQIPALEKILKDSHFKGVGFKPLATSMEIRGVCMKCDDHNAPSV